MSGKIVVAAFGAICLALAIAGCAARNYYVLETVIPFTGGSIYSGIGLFESGTGSTKFSINDGVKKTESIGEKKNKLGAAQAFGILGALASTAAIAAGFLEQKKIVQIALFAFAAFSGVIVLAVFSMGSMGISSPFEYGGAFGMCMLIYTFFFLLKKYQCP